MFLVYHVNLIQYQNIRCQRWIYLRGNKIFIISYCHYVWICLCVEIQCYWKDFKRIIFFINKWDLTNRCKYKKMSMSCFLTNLWLSLFNSSFLYDWNYNVLHNVMTIHLFDSQLHAGQLYRTIITIIHNYPPNYIRLQIQSNLYPMIPLSFLY